MNVSTWHPDRPQNKAATILYHMKHKLLLFITSVSLLCCQSPDVRVEDQKTATADAADSGQAQSYNPLLPNPATGEITEYLLWESISINGRLPLATTVKNMEAVLGKPDSVVSINWSETCVSNFKSEDSKLAYYKGMQFEQYGDSLYFKVNDFRKNHNVFLQSGSLRLR